MSTQVPEISPRVHENKSMLLRVFFVRNAGPVHYNHEPQYALKTETNSMSTGVNVEHYTLKNTRSQRAVQAQVRVRKVEHLQDLACAHESVQWWYCACIERTEKKVVVRPQLMTDVKFRRCRPLCMKLHTFILMLS